MCLLDGVLEWNDAALRCVSHRHRAIDNPLRRTDGLAGICGIEFAAQAMALHGRLAARADGQPAMGYLVSLRDVTCRAPRLDILGGDLLIAAERLAGDDAQALYRFALTCEGAAIVEGRATAMLRAVVR
jgi:predicted hotdog family 3-hydroxylacyl-ACP dehydratase